MESLSLNDLLKIRKSLIIELHRLIDDDERNLGTKYLLEQEEYARLIRDVCNAIYERVQPMEKS